MRVIAGRLKGRRLASPTWTGLRPTSDKLRETLFNVLGARVIDARLLDGFAGTGAIGIEAMSRGAAHVTFVEPDARAVTLLERNLASCGVGSGYTVWPTTLAGAARRVDATHFDVIVLDPPYDEPDLDTAVALAAGWLAEGGLVVLEHAKRRAVPDDADGVRRVRTILSGDSALSFYEPAVS